MNYSCEICSKGFSHRNYLTRHIKSVHEHMNYSCEICSKGFSHRNYLNRHIKSVHEHIKYSCEICKKIFSRRHDLKTHIESVHENVKHACHECDKSFSYRSSLCTHQKTIHNNVKHVCQECGNTFTQRSTLRDHHQAVHENVKHVCHECGNTFTQRSTLRVHQKSVHEKIRHNCHECGKTFSKKNNLRTHQKLIHDKLRHDTFEPSDSRTTCCSEESTSHIIKHEDLVNNPSNSNLAGDESELSRGDLNLDITEKRLIEVIPAMKTAQQSVLTHDINMDGSSHKISQNNCDSPKLRPAVNSDVGVHWAVEGQLHLLSQQIIFFNGPTVREFSDTFFKLHIVPAFSGGFSTQSSGDQRPTLQLKMEEGTPNVLHEEREADKLHTDLNTTNVFQLVHHPPYRSEMTQGAHISRETPWAVQLSNCIFPLTEPCWIRVPKGPHAYSVILHLVPGISDLQDVVAYPKHRNDREDGSNPGGLSDQFDDRERPIDPDAASVPVDFSPSSTATGYKPNESTVTVKRHRHLSPSFALCLSTFSLAFCCFLVHGAIARQPTHLLPYFFLQVFDFIISLLTVVGYMSSTPDLRLWLRTKDGAMYINSTSWTFLLLFVSLLVLAFKAYCLRMVWDCYKYLMLTHNRANGNWSGDRFSFLPTIWGLLGTGRRSGLLRSSVQVSSDNRTFGTDSGLEQNRPVPAVYDQSNDLPNYDDALKIPANAYAPPPYFVTTDSNKPSNTPAPPTTVSTNSDTNVTSSPEREPPRP